MADLSLEKTFEKKASMTNLRRKMRWGETIIQGLLFFSGFFSIFTTLGIVYELGKEALLFFQMPEVNLLATLTTTEWKPHIGKFGIWPLLNATLMTTLIAMLIAIPLGMAVAIYLSEYANPRVRNTLKPILEVLAGIPTIVYGYFALTFMTPLLREIFAQHRHIDAEEILVAVRASGHSISRATVYRNLELLVECGLVSRVKLGARTVYEHLHPGLRHDHVACRDCGRIVEFVSPGVTALLAEICRAHGFEPAGNQVQIVGLCRDCAAVDVQRHPLRGRVQS